MVVQSFSWQDFLLAAVALLVLWYVGLALFFRKGKPGGSSGAREPLPHGWQDEVDEISDQQELLGKTAMDHGVSVVEAEDFSFSQRQDPVPGQADQLGLIADVQQEIKSICSLLAEQDGTKEHFFSLFALVRDKYPRAGQSPQLEALNEFIRLQVPFHLSEQELENLWV